MDYHHIKMEQIDLDFDSNLDGPFRARSNTWPVARPENSEFPETFVQDMVKCEGDVSLGVNGEQSVIPTTAHDMSPMDQQTVGQIGPKKNTSRRNAWGNMSYADLITQAINGSPEKRLTLSQIYDWMVQNVPYFKDKGDSNSSAGWKNSIRHNLSLHNRFMRVQNEGTGKSSWWMINPDAKPGKAARRRATSMETQKYEKKRGRVKKKVEQLRNGLISEHHTPSPSSSVSEGLDLFPDSPLHHGFNLSPDFRPRASSNASSCGRLSPIPAVENDMHDNQVPPLSPISGWSSELGRMYSGINDVDQFSSDQQQLVDSLTNTMKLGGNSAFLGVTKASPTSQLSPASSHVTLNNNYNLSNYGLNCYSNGSVRNAGSNTDTYFQGLENTVTNSNGPTLTALNTVNGPRSPSRLLTSDVLGSNGTYNLTNLSPALSPSQSMDTLVPTTVTYTTSFQNPQSNSAQNRTFIANQTLIDNQALLRSLNPSNNRVTVDSSLLAISPVSTTNSNSNTTQSSVTSLGTTASQVVGHLLSLNNQLPNDLDLNAFDAIQGGLECDVDQVIRHELSVEGTLDFNFDPSLHHHNHHNHTAQAANTTVASALPYV